MITIKHFVFNPFQENTYLLWDETKECVIIDPGCYDGSEKQELERFIASNQLNPVKLLLTHAHIDHILGNNFITARYKLAIEMHEQEIPVLKNASIYSDMWGIQFEPTPDASVYVDESTSLRFGNSALEILFTPGHSPGSICFYNKEQRFIIGGDVLFQNSIGRTDLPGGDFNTLLASIRIKLFSLEDDTVVYPGHGPTTTIGDEKKHNPFVGLNAFHSM